MDLFKLCTWGSTWNCLNLYTWELPWPHPLPLPLPHGLLHLGTPPPFPRPVGKGAAGLRLKSLLVANNLVLSLFGNNLLHYSNLHCKSQPILCGPYLFCEASDCCLHDNIGTHSVEKDTNSLGARCSRVK